jgi:hypothetical protein
MAEIGPEVGQKFNNPVFTYPYFSGHGAPLAGSLPVTPMPSLFDNMGLYTTRSLVSPDANFYYSTHLLWCIVLLNYIV